MRNQRSWSVIVALLVSCCMGSNMYAQQISSQRSELTRRHGPWMVQVAAFRNPEDSKSAKATASALVKELRQKGIPAYSTSQTIETQGQMTESEIVETVVLAGNFQRFNSPQALKTLFYLRELKDPAIVKLIESRVKTPNTSLDKPFMRKNPLVVEHKQP